MTQSSLDGFEFSIDTSSYFIFDLLRSKIYSNPIQSICREVCSNARDANRFVGKGDVPIEVTLPTGNVRFFIVKDCGPGISPDLVENVFVKYASSTKRNDDTQTGGFGLGAKTPFAYSDSFNVTTIYQGVRYQYLCFIDESKKGKMSLIDSHPTDEPNGTTVSVPVNYSDFNKFHTGFFESVKYWDVKPTCNFTIPKNKIFFENELGLVTEQENYYNKFGVLIDGIYYQNNSINTGFSNKILLKFKSNELSISPNRETLHLDSKTTKAIENRFLLFKNSLKEQKIKEIESQPTFLEALALNIDVTNTYHSFFTLPKITWKGFELPNTNCIKLDDIFLNVKIHNGKSLKKDLIKDHFVYLNKPTYIDDIGIDLEKIDLLKKSILENFHENSQILLNEEKVKSKIPFYDFLDVKKLSTVVNKLKDKKAKEKITIFKYLPNQVGFYRTSVKSYDEDNNKKLFVFINKEKNLYVNNELHSSYVLGSSNILEKNGISIYASNSGFKDKVKENFDDFISFEDFMKEEINSKKETIEDYLSNLNLKDKRLQNYRSNLLFLNSAQLIKDELKTECLYIDKLIEYKNSFSYERNEYLDLLISLASKLFEINFEIKTKPLNDLISKDYISKKEQEFLQKYPLLNCVNSIHLASHIKDIANYIDMINNNS